MSDTNGSPANNSTICTVDTWLAREYVAIFGTVFSVLSLAGLMGNLLVIVAVSVDSRMKTVMNLLLLNLATADFANLFFCAPDWMQPIIQGCPTWLLPDFLCAILRYLEYISLYTSILTQVAVCFERFVAIRFPMKARFFCTRKKAKLTSAGIWIFSALYAVPYAWYHKVVVRNNSPQCVMTSFRYQLAYKLSECLIFYFCPLILIVALYSVISRVLWSANQQLHEGNTSADNSETLKVRKNIVKMLVACVCVYFLCYSPIQALFLSAVFGKVKVQMTYVAVLMLNALAYACSAVNPFLYTVFSSKFRRKFAELLGCRKKETPTLTMSRYADQSLEPTEASKLLRTSHVVMTRFSAK